MKRLLILFLLIGTACTPAQMNEASAPPSIPASDPAPTHIPLVQDVPATSASSPMPSADIFSELGAPTCAGLTPENTEGPYYTPDTTERKSLLEEGWQGDKLILIGYVLDSNCQPIPGAWLDFWQADANGEYDNSGYNLRGHQFTDEQGRYTLETIMPGLYSSRPIRHIHVKIRVPGGEVVTTQLYFPEQPIDGLTVQLEDKGDYHLGIFNFVVR